MVLLLPPAPAALVLVGRALATLSARSAAAFRLCTIFAPPGGEDGRAVVPAEEGGGEDEDGGGDDCGRKLVRSRGLGIGAEERKLKVKKGGNLSEYCEGRSGA